MGMEQSFQLRLMGSFQLASPSGQRIRIPSKKGMALIALVAVARSGERTRAFLQDHLWGSRGTEQAQASLRRELANLRAALSAVPGKPLVIADAVRVAIDLEWVAVDARDIHGASATGGIDEGEFLEGFDIAEEAFEDWLRQQRSQIESLRRDPDTPPPVVIGSAAERLAAPAFPADRPTISVLAPVNEGSHEDGVYLEGVAELLAERIARLRWLAVIATPPGIGEGDADRLGHRLGVAYQLRCRLAGGSEGGGNRVHIALSEVATARLLWSRGYVMAAAPEGAALTSIAEETVAALTARIEVEQELRALDRGTQTLAPNELIWRARWHMRRLTSQDAAIAAQLLEQAAAENGNDPAVLIEQTTLAGWRIWSARGGIPEKKAFRAMASKARHADPFEARAYHLCGVAELWLGNHDAARMMFAEALELNPSMATAYGHYGSCQSMAGDPAAAIPLLETALRLNPFNMESFHQFGELALANFMLGQHRAAINAADRALALRPAYFHAHAIKIAALCELGEAESEARARTALAAAKPDTRSEALEWLPFADRRWITKLRNALDRPALRLAV